MNQKQLDYINEKEKTTVEMICSLCEDTDTRQEGMCSGCSAFLMFRDNLINKEKLKELGKDK